MDDKKNQERYREQDERNTLERAAILGLEYLDTRTMEATMPLAPNVLPVQSMYKGHIVPLKAGNDADPYLFGITSSTPQSAVKTLRENYNKHGFNVHFALISASGFRAFMRRYDPPKEVVY